jgi:acetolactate synthase-1/2/3 large subunit
MNTQGFRQPQPPTLISVDLVEPVNYPPDILLRADARDVLLRMLVELPDHVREPWWQSVGGRPAMPFLDALEAALPDDAVLVADMCVAGYWYGGFGRVRQPRGLAYPVGWGTLGFGFPLARRRAVGAADGRRRRGDGGFLFACGDWPRRRRSGCR